MTDSEDYGDEEEYYGDEEEDAQVIEILEHSKESSLDFGNDSEHAELEPKVSEQFVKVYLPNQSSSDANVRLVYDESAYIFYHQAKTGAPCLSFDIIKDDLGYNRIDKYPLTMTVIAGTQAGSKDSNNLIVLKMSNIKKGKGREVDNSDSSDDEDTPQLECAKVKHKGCVNRVKVTSMGKKPIAASWSELGRVFIWDMSYPLRAVNDRSIMKKYSLKKEEAPSPIFVFDGHQKEGFGMAWSPHVPGMLVTGDCNKNMHLWKPVESGMWHVNLRPYKGHASSVEDIEWSPTESNVIASCSTDKSIRIWDIRASPEKACMLAKKDAHDSDVNVINWNKTEPFIISGGDDGVIKVWDLRKFPSKSPICTFKHHAKAITSLEWHPTDSSVYAASGADDQLTLWDLSVERDTDAAQQEGLSPEVAALPPQLLFIHQGQKEIKELHFHPQMPGVVISTSLTGFDIFRTVNV